MIQARKQSTTTYPVVFLMVDSTDHVTGKTGLTPTVTISKNGAGFGAAAGAVSELTNGWYALAGNATDRATLGSLAIHASATGADPTDLLVLIVSYDPFVDIATMLAVTPAYAPLINASGRVDVGAWLGVAPAALSASGYLQSMLMRWLTDNAAGTPDALSTNKLPADVKLWLAAAPAALTTNGYIQSVLMRWLTDNAAGTPLALTAAYLLQVSAVVSAAVDLIDALKNKAGSSGYNRTTDSLEALGEKSSV